VRLNSYTFARTVAKKLSVPSSEAARMVRSKWADLGDAIGAAGIARLDQLPGDPNSFLQELKKDNSEPASWFVEMLS
jgi:hypothetical protein